jgi:hypothetical protein
MDRGQQLMRCVRLYRTSHKRPWKRQRPYNQRMQCVELPFWRKTKTIQLANAVCQIAILTKNQDHTTSECIVSNCHFDERPFWRKTILTKDQDHAISVSNCHFDKSPKHTISECSVSNCHFDESAASVHPHPQNRTGAHTTFLPKTRQGTIRVRVRMRAKFRLGMWLGLGL